MIRMYNFCTVRIKEIQTSFVFPTSQNWIPSVPIKCEKTRGDAIKNDGILGFHIIGKADLHPQKGLWIWTEIELSALYTGSTRIISSHEYPVQVPAAQGTPILLVVQEFHMQVASHRQWTAIFNRFGWNVKDMGKKRKSHSAKGLETLPEGNSKYLLHIFYTGYAQSSLLRQ